MSTPSATNAANGAKIAKTFCRLCEVSCGLEAEVADGRLLALRPDKAHPISQGFACHKGLLARDVHLDPDRLAVPLARSEHGFVERGWNEAVEDIAARLTRILEESGPESIGVYLGNPSAFNAVGTMASGMFASSLGVSRLFNAGTQDCANKFAVSEILYGSAEVHPIADLDRCELLLLFGTNPRISKMSFLSVPDPVGALRGLRRRGGAAVFVNPLEISDLADVGETLQIRPDTDVYLLAAMLCEIDRDPELGFRVQDLRGLDRVRELVRRYPAERVAEVVGIDAGRIRELARRFAQARGAAIHVSTGVNMGRQGALAYWLAQMLSLVTGNLGEPGGNVFSARGIAPMVMPDEVSRPVDSRWGRYRPPRGTPPGALLADMCLDREAPLRAMIVFAGNPLLSIGGGPRLERGLSSLDLLVSVDLYRNATAELADWALPATDWFEREDLNFFVQGVQSRPYLQWTDAVVEPRDERRPEWWIVSRILQEMGRPSLLDIPGGDLMQALWGGRLAEAGHSLDALRREKVLPLEAGPQRAPLGEIPGEDFDCCPDALHESLDRAEVIFEDLSNESRDTLKLITRRTNYMLNSGFQNLKALKRPSALTNPLYVSPPDAARLGISEGQHVRVRNDFGELVAEVAIDSALRPGVVAMSHGYGNAKTPGMPNAQAAPGVNVNVLSPVGAGSFDPVSAMSQLTGIVVEVLVDSADPAA